MTDEVTTEPVESTAPLSMQDAIKLVEGLPGETPEPQAEEKPVAEADAAPTEDQQKQEQAQGEDANDTPNEVEAKAETEGEVELDPDEPIRYEDAVELTVQDADGNEVSVSDLLSQQVQKREFRQNLEELTAERRELEQAGIAARDFQQAVMSEMANLVNHYKEYWDQLGAPGQQILRQIAEMHDGASVQRQTWRESFDARIKKARTLEVRNNAKVLKGFVPDWDVHKYNAILKHYETQYGTNPDLINDIVDPGIMAGLYAGMQTAHARRKLKLGKRTQEKQPTPVRSAGTEQAPDRGHKRMPERFNSIQDAVAFIANE